MTPKEKEMWFEVLDDSSAEDLHNAASLMLEYLDDFIKPPGSSATKEQSLGLILPLVVEIQRSFFWFQKGVLQSQYEFREDEFYRLRMELGMELD